MLPAFISGYGIRILNLACISAIAVIGLNFAFGYAGLITLAQAGFVGCGAYITAILSTTAGFSPWLSIPAAAFGADVHSGRHRPADAAPQGPLPRSWRRWASTFPSSSSPPTGSR